MTNYEKDNVENLKIPKDYFTANVNYLQWAGIPMKEVKDPLLKVLYYIYSRFMLFVFVYFYTFCEIWYGLVNVNDFDKLLFALSYAVNHVMGCAKVTVMILKRKSILQSFDKLEKGRFIPNIERGGIQEIKLVQEAVSLVRNQVIIWAVIIVIMLSNRLLYVLRHQTIEVVSPDNPNITIVLKQLPYVTHYIIEFDMQKSPNYEIVYAHQMLSIWICAWYIGNADAITNGLMIHLTAQFKIAANSFLTITQRAKRITEQNQDTRGKSNLSKDIPKLFKILPKSMGEIEEIPAYSGEFAKNLEYCIKEAIQHHQAILDLADDMEETFNLVLLSQFFSSLSTYCFLLYQLSQIPLDPTSILLYQVFLFLTGMILQLFVFCWNGNEMTEASESVAYATYNSQWIPAQKHIRMFTMFATLRAQRPAYVTAGKFSKLSMATFASILRTSVSYFMVLKNANK